ncbi:hypothetical protein [Clostridium senegalense]|uniref:hypothetical protein n=1 Tax=Clostridium senegalense TaxID=1465809 RepID=UPI001C1117B4|nr:hypothetical protein [Clostridium senegalense]MBU5227833.1 hypothetical protein [Clostridium senegalense]
MNQFDKELYKIQQKEAMQDLKDDLNNIFEKIKVTVEIERRYFEELISQGFTDLQALEIIKAHGVDYGKASQMKKSDD